MRKLIMILSMVLGLYYLLGGLASSLVLANWHDARSVAARPNEASRFQWFCGSIWFIGTGLCFLTGWLWMFRKVPNSGEKLISVTCLSAGGIALWALVVWRQATVIEAALTAAVVAVLLVASLKRANWR